MNKDHIVHLSGALDRGSCQSLIDIFESLNEYHEEGKIGDNRVDYNLKKCIEILFRFYDDFKIHPCPPRTIFEEMRVPVYTEVNFVNCIVESFMKYAQEYSFIDILPKTQVYQGFKIQKYNPGECYSQLHCESMGSQLHRVLAWMIYLNDVTEGGETEFPSQDKKFQPRCGDVLFWPAHFTHPHRGIASKTQVKYIVTGWTVYTDPIFD
tara:strand:- start:39 stop:665 length:627 start_codon:yes stop_codon:yes gene_type:complete